MKATRKLAKLSAKGFGRGCFIKLHRIYKRNRTEGKIYFEYLPVGLTSLDMSNSYL